MNNKVRKMLQQLVAMSVLLPLLVPLPARSLTLAFLPQERQVTVLTLNKPVQGELSKGEVHSYQIDLKSGQYARALIHQVGMYAGMAIYGPKDQKLLELKCRREGRTPLSLIAGTSGFYRLDIRSLETGAAIGGYEVRVEDIRPATAADERRVNAERVSSEGESLQTEGNAESSRKAIKKYEEALLDWQATGDRREQSYTRKTIGEIYHDLGSPKRAIDYYNQALLLGQALKDLSLESETLSDIAASYTQLGDNQIALEYCTKALQLSREVNNRPGEGAALNCMGEVYYAFGNKLKAVEYYEQALVLWRSLNDRRRLSQTLWNCGYAYSDLGDTRKAFDLYDQALSFSRLINDRRGQTSILTAMGYAYSRLGKKQEALNAYYQAQQLVRLIGDPIEEARILNGIAFVYEELGEQDRTLDYYTQSLRIYRTVGYKRGEVSVRLAIGQVHQSKGDYREALAHFAQALPETQTLKDQSLESYALKDLGSAYDSLGQTKKALDFYDRAIALYRELGDRRGQSSTLLAVGSIYDDRGSKEKALSYYNDALSLSRSVVDRFTEVTTLFRIAHVERDLGRLTEARAHVEDATSRIESLRTNVASQELRASFLAAVRQDYELHIDLLMRLHRQHPSAGLNDAAALHISERARARSLIELLSESRADIRQGVDPALLEHERSLQQLLSDKTERYSQLLSSTSHAAEQAALARELETIKTDYEQVQAQIRTTSPRYAALTQPQPLSLSEIQEQVLDPDTLLLEYALGDKRSYLWAVTPSSLASFDLPARADVEAAARRVYELLTARNQIVKGETAARKDARLARAEADYPTAAAALSRMVLGPAASYLGKKRLLIVADGALQYIPFAALPVPDGPRDNLQPSANAKDTVNYGPTPLIVEHEIVSLPSASALAVLRRQLAGRKPAAKAIAVLADPVFSRSDPRVGSTTNRRAPTMAVGQPIRDVARAIREAGLRQEKDGIQRLSFSRREAAAITSLVPPGEAMEAVDFEASRATAVSPELSQYRIVHFATHGLLNREHPELSGIVLSLVNHEGESQNGFLRLHEVYNLNLPAELVVLSACQTGLGKDIKGEGIVGLTRGFMYAGAARVMASLWSVEDLATADLMRRFYGKMLRDGLRPPAALREAQIEMWRQKNGQSPYFWAGFTLQGEWR